MFIGFVEALRRGGIPASLKEHLLLLEAMDAEVIAAEPEQFYYLARATFVHDESQLDRFDRIFATVFKGVVGAPGEDLRTDIPEDWLRLVAENYLTPEQMAEINALGSWDEIMEALKARLAEQEGRHQGGNKWIGTGGTSPFGAYGYNPEGIRIGQEPWVVQAVLGRGEKRLQLTRRIQASAGQQLRQARVGLAVLVGELLQLGLRRREPPVLADEVKVISQFTR